MATLQVQGPDFSVTKQKAIEDAKMMQASVIEQCTAVGQEVPPYVLSELIGKGSFGRVYKATSGKSSQLVAVKIIDIEESDTINPKFSDTYGEFLKEVNALKLLSNGKAKNINHVIDALPVGQSMWMITEYCAGGSVATLMKPTAPGGLQERWIIPILREVAEAIFWVHKQGIIHRDIKCANILVHEAGGVQLCDFGVAGIMETKVDKRSTFIGTLHWMAPELFAFDQAAAYGTEVDIWAFGSMVYEIASGLPPNTQMMDMVRLGNHLKQHAPRLEGDQYSDGLKDLVAYCLEELPQNRPTIEQLQRHPYIFNSATKYPTTSLAILVRAYKLWEGKGGSRKSLFAPGGAQPSQDVTSTALATDEWNFSTTAAFDQQVFRDNDPQTVYDAYGSEVDFHADQSDAEQTSRPQKGRGGRRRPPNVPVLKAPLEKLFDPNTLTGYAENSKNYYGALGPPPPPASDLPLRDESSGHGSDVRESLIDLDASLEGSDLSRFADMDTIRPGASAIPRVSIDYSMSEPQDFIKPPLSDPEQFNSNRRTQDWKFPTMTEPPASANPEMSRFPFNSDQSAPSSGASSLRHYTAGSITISDTSSISAPDSTPFVFPAPSTASTSVPDPLSFSFPSSTSIPDPLDFSFPSSESIPDPRDFSFPRSTSVSNIRIYDAEQSLAVPRAASQASNRVSGGSLIDLDMSLPDSYDPFESARPSTAHSDVGSIAGSEFGGANPFDLERDANYPTTIREPSIYVSDDLDINGGGGSGSGFSLAERRGRYSRNHSLSDFSDSDFRPSQVQPLGMPPPARGEGGKPGDVSITRVPVPRPGWATVRNGGLSDRGEGLATRGGAGGQLSFPPPAPPSERVMLGQAGLGEVKGEFRRLMMSFGEHLNLASERLGELPVPRGRGEIIQE
ncbi:related to severin kinase [Cephalotrichum gorgonifer]|uniref:non-specific serine/threonine protein kinase n=1 Tax=Cephalotrichum gorgonifer TaxID=2041049 RepID=A0AAE8SR59_9PEZI|nr:related to severin kinase [Cephalotrichum gorgonifer]